jgi:hypothetical protein
MDQQSMNVGRKIFGRVDIFLSNGCSNAGTAFRAM